jgi:putative transcriptional regulator
MIQIQIKQLLAVRQQQWGKQITLTEVSGRTGISRMTLHRALKNQQYKLSTDSIDRLCSFFKCDLTDLLRYVDDQEAV